MAFISIKNMTFRYPNSNKDVIKNVSLSVDEGDFIVIAGSSGCGKTTLIRHLKPELSPYGQLTGEILYDNKPIKSINQRQEASEIGYVMQNPQNQIVTDKVWHELAFGLENLGYPTEQIRLRVCEMATYFGINNLFDKNTADLSGGQMQLLNLAAIMTMQPRLLILDEPTAQLDPISASDFINTIKKINKDMGITIILIEHRLEEVFHSADKVLILDEGSILFFDKPDKITDKMNLKEFNKISLALPTSIRIFKEFNIKSCCPLTIRDARRFLSENFNSSNIPIKDKENVHDYKKDNVIIELKDIWFRYEKEDVVIIKGISFKIYKGEILSILGANGAGKTTLLSLLAAFKKPYKGKIKLDNKDILKYKSYELYKGNIGFLPQNPQTLFMMDSVIEDLKQTFNKKTDEKQVFNAKLKEIITLLEIDNLLQSHPYDLSGGEQQKVALAKILLLNPRILLLDEPTKGLDAYSKNNLGLILKQLKNRGVTVIIVTHDIEFSASFTNRCALMFNGEIIAQGSPNNFFGNNNFYTTSANKISRHLFNNAVTCEDVITLCKKNQKLKD